MSSRRHAYEELDRQLMDSGHRRRSPSRSPPRKKYESGGGGGGGSRSRRYRSRSHEGGGGGGGGRNYGGRGRSRSRSPMARRRPNGGGRPIPENIVPNKCLGVFGLSLRTTERDLRDVFSRYGPIEECTVVIDAQTGRSRGFSFIYFESIEDSKAAKESCNGIEIDGRRIRVDFSITQRAHTPTPGIYMGHKNDRGGGGGGRSYRRRDDRDGRDFPPSRRDYRDRGSPPRRERYSRSRSPH